jgi:hydroxymethylpyrimidine/phosphomethylpyrimidine kinase
LGAQNVLLKGGHWDGENSVDLCFDGERLFELTAPRIHGYEVRGTGCLLASAIAAQRARGVLPLESAREAKSWLNEKIRRAEAIGHGRRIVVR